MSPGEELEGTVQDRGSRLHEMEHYHRKGYVRLSYFIIPQPNEILYKLV